VIVVSNASPIINLAVIGQLLLLERLYGKIIIPEAVYHEIAVGGAGKAGATEVQTLEWIETRQVGSPLSDVPPGLTHRSAPADTDGGHQNAS